MTFRPKKVFCVNRHTRKCILFQCHWVIPQFHQVPDIHYTQVYGVNWLHTDTVSYDTSGCSMQRVPRTLTIIHKPYKLCTWHTSNLVCIHHSLTLEHYVPFANIVRSTQFSQFVSFLTKPHRLPLHLASLATTSLELQQLPHEGSTSPTIGGDTEEKAGKGFVSHQNKYFT